MIECGIEASLPRDLKIIELIFHSQTTTLLPYSHFWMPFFTGSGTQGAESEDLRPSLADLPSEILLNIVDHIPIWPKNGTQDNSHLKVGSIACLALCSKRLNEITRSGLYHKYVEDSHEPDDKSPIVSDDEDSDDEETHVSHDGFKPTKPRKAPPPKIPTPLPLFLRTIIEKPELANLVKVYHGNDA